MTAVARIVEVQERGQRFFPRPDLVDPQGHSRILPETRALGAIEVRDVANGAQLMALGVIGYLPLTPSITLNIVPKFPIQNLWTMLEIGGENYQNILPTLRRYQTSTNPAPIQMLARSFCHYLNQTVASGFERSYYACHRTGYYRPRVDFGRTINQFISRGNPVNTVSSVFEFGLDSPVNQLIKAACLRFARLIPAGAAWNDERRLLRYALETLQRVNSCESKSLDFEAEATVSSRVRPQYAGMLRIYHLLLTAGGISFMFEPNGKELPSFLFKLEDIFERFVRQVFVSGLRAHGIAVLDGNKHRGYLFEDSRVYPTKSDLVFQRSKRNVIGIGEVKYKPKLKEWDRYQIISYATSARAPVGILFTPADEGESQRLERVGRMSTGAQFYHYRVNIQGDIHAAANQMIRDVLAILTPPSQSTAAFASPNGPDLG
jgi:5-methylcytosine-specific restriction enzyme subunit McrC